MTRIKFLFKFMLVGGLVIALFGVFPALHRSAVYACTIDACIDEVNAEIQNAEDELNMRNGPDPNYVYSTTELAGLAAKDELATQHMQAHIALRSADPSYLTVSPGSVDTNPTGPDAYAPDPNANQPTSLGHKVLSVGTWLEPNDYAHRNYCGPGATQVVLNARLASSQVPDIDTIGREEYIDPSFGVYTSNIRPVLNRRLNTTFYYVSGASSKENFDSRIFADVDYDYAMVTALRTAFISNGASVYMPGWNRDVKHLVALYGYDEPDAYRLFAYYTETGGTVAGYTGNYRNTMRTGRLWKFVARNNSQVW